jgi:hypothetical protein
VEYGNQNVCDFHGKTLHKNKLQRVDLPESSQGQGPSFPITGLQGIRYRHIDRVSVCHLKSTPTSVHRS